MHCSIVNSAGVSVSSAEVLLLTAGPDLNNVVRNLSETEIVRNVCDNGAGVTDE